MAQDLFAPMTVGDVALKNRIVMAPMTRCRAIGNVPNELMATYYAQRATAGLLITEGTTPAPEGLGYARIPGIFSEAQVAGWKLVAEAVHAKGGRIFVQLMHTGRVGHPANLPEGVEMLAPSAVAAVGEMWTDSQGMQPHPTPRAMTEGDIARVIQSFAQGARHARAAGLDGIELHGANGYLLEQFFHPAVNLRTDTWGGDYRARGRFILEVAKACVASIGAGRVGIRLSPHGVFNDMAPYKGVEEAYTWLAGELGKLGLAYLHGVDHSPMGAPEVPQATKDAMRAAFKGTVILSGGFDRARAEADLAAGKGDLVAFGRPFLANPDLVDRMKQGTPLQDPDPATFYTPGPEGYTDYQEAGRQAQLEVG